jgi:formylglycine-generating enzyme required for sulfatase activity
VAQNWQTGEQNVVVETKPKKRGFLSPLVFGLAALAVLFFIGVAAVVGAYMLGFIGSKPAANISNSTSPTPSGTVVPAITPQMIAIPGGTFVMGRNDGRDDEKPEHPVDVQPFAMDKTEVTNEEYFAFVSETNYRPIPGHWVNDRPKAGQEKMPVRDVNIDDVNAFIAWRSKRDRVTYRLPTEQEWEYAARNGRKGNLYPWGDKFEAKCAVTDKSVMEPTIVGAASCPNDWGVMDLIGNVYEWTGSKAEPYPGSVRITESKEPENMVRGGCAQNRSGGEFAITSTSRQVVPVSKRDLQLGFRLVKSN